METLPGSERARHGAQLLSPAGTGIGRSARSVALVTGQLRWERRLSELRSRHRSRSRQAGGLTPQHLNRSGSPLPAEAIAATGTPPGVAVRLQVVTEDSKRRAVARRPRQYCGLNETCVADLWAGRRLGRYATMHGLSVDRNAGGRLSTGWCRDNCVRSSRDRNSASAGRAGDRVHIGTVSAATHRVFRPTARRVCLE